ncbi:nucleotide sugar dehydrogenase [Thermaerobacter marianensis DSM 12885]|uniref:Nucleotide sugar dehydrogenase n=1 Tax=Thermaerobacter marianensis (strain ATCC 700841 / DSM 12885 / JCM 10246 / 7p75a) TaxID=644966 RepID=E6SHR0_THEM7|nr:nucleotide sugar dehydrogenase [Thermaerobacter marianensis]ADU50757.1 nucleotide sugar dehydrogenase [Thermaerobacter marianensis DSM 12885]
MPERIAVIGLGYVGLPTALLFAGAGVDVLGVDINPELVAALEAGQCPVEEPGLPELLKEVLASGRFRVTQRLESRDVYIITVPTPLDRETGGADLSAVRKAAEAVAEVARPGQMVILESTVPPGTLNRLVRPIIESRVPGLDYVFSPERVLPGRILIELPGNPRLIGADSPRAAERARALYATFVRGEIRITDPTTAELVKLMENTYRDVNIALANEFAMVAERVGVNVWEAIELANLHPRVNIHRPGPGVGGHCIAVDPWFVVERAPMVTALIRQARTTNDRMPVVVAERVEELTLGRGLGTGAGAGAGALKVGLLGLAYKGNSDDSRESPAYVLARILRSRGFDVAAYDPLVRRGALPNATLEETARGAHVLVLVTDHDRFREIDPVALRQLVARPVLLDTRNHLDHARWRAAGFEVHVLGDGKGRRAGIFGEGAGPAGELAGAAPGADRTRG